MGVEARPVLSRRSVWRSSSLEEATGITGTSSVLLWAVALPPVDAVLSSEVVIWNGLRCTAHMLRLEVVRNFAHAQEDCMRAVWVLEMR